MKCCVVIPTYNEKENISKLIRTLFRVFESIEHDMHILIVDDNSPDGTSKVVRNFTSLYRNVHLLTGKKKGLGAAYIKGFRHVKDRFDLIVMMDADFSHDPYVLPKLIQEIENGYDIAVGSRYVPGGKTPDWSLTRKLISRGGNFFARVIGGLYRVHDCTTAYRAIKTELLRKIDFKYLATRGYAFLTTLLYECHMRGAKIKEIPITFYDRKFGQTKLTRKDMMQFFLNAFRLRLRTGQRFTRFLTVGFSGMIVNTLLLWMLMSKGLHLLTAGAIAVETSILFNFVLNDIYTFNDQIGKSDFAIRMLRFNGVALYGFIVHLSILWLLTYHAGMNYLSANLIGIIGATIFNYIAVINYTWRVQSNVYYSKKFFPFKVSQ
jgi:dolichol-phosphate mannosyltransferase